MIDCFQQRITLEINADIQDSHRLD
jgi:hypothetical protein